MNTRSIFRQLHYRTQQALDLAFPLRCAGCKRVGSVLCAACFAQLQPVTPFPYKQGWAALQGLVAVNAYQGSLRDCIHALKYDGVVRLAEPLGTLLAQTYMNYGMQADILMSVPLHSERHRQRGYNHAHLLASVCASTLGIPLRDDVLVRSRATNTQVGLNAYDRRQNVAGAFSIATGDATAHIYKRRIIIVDDVCTTGATLDACAATLFQAGAVSVWGLVLAGSAV
ncbi:MAG: phosphoribosyltransferase family protein [Ktedonobacteraceae bacterium]